MLEDLKVLNGDMPLKFDTLNNIYTVNVASDVASLELEYIVNDAELEILGNDNLKSGLNEIVLTVYNEDERINYYLYVYKDKTVNNEIINIENLEVKPQEEVSEYALPCIASVCFLIILVVFTILFKKKKNY